MFVDGAAGLPAALYRRSRDDDLKNRHLFLNIKTRKISKSGFLV